MKTAVSTPGSGPSPDTGSASALVTDFPASRAVKNKRLLLKPLSDNLLQQPELRQEVNARRNS